MIITSVGGVLGKPVITDSILDEVATPSFRRKDDVETLIAHSCKDGV
ncbi:hypothetical protein J7K52_04540 [Candidatus Bathyarchaeota archaeon]|nr:hypothetical protein [Candidatus Bathyarchaeota archaeon]